jgi:hypothetical protein
MEAAATDSLIFLPSHAPTLPRRGVLGRGLQQVKCYTRRIGITTETGEADCRPSVSSVADSSCLDSRART